MIETIPSAGVPKGAVRSLAFTPIRTTGPKILTHAQIESYNDRGYLLPFDIFDEPQATSNRAYFDSLLADMNSRNDGRDSYAINGYQTRCRGIYDLATNPLILDLVEDLVGPNIVCWGTHFFCKQPHDPRRVAWHQDASYWPFDKSQTVTVWLAIDDADVANACMHVIPGTHKMGQLKWKDSTAGNVLDQEVVDALSYGTPVPFELRAGQVSLHADMLVHGSEANTSDRRRCGLTLRYCPVSVRALTDWNTNAIICRGVDPDGHWQYHDRPEGDDISRLAPPRKMGAN